MDADLAALIRVRQLTESGAARSIRIAARLSQPDVAARVGVTVPTISRWERGQRRPQGEGAIRYARLLDELMAGAR